MSYLISTTTEAYTIKEIMIDRVVINFDHFLHYNSQPSYGVNPPTFVVTGAQIDLIVQAGLLQARCKRVYVWMTTTSHGQS